MKPFIISIIVISCLIFINLLLFTYEKFIKKNIYYSILPIKFILKTILLPYYYPKFFLILVILGGIIFIIIFFFKENEKAEKEAKDPNARLNECLETIKFNKKTKFEEFPLMNFNKFYNSDVYYFVRDYYICASNKSYLPCGASNDIVSLVAIKNVLDFGARFIDLDIFYYRPDNTFSSMKEKQLYIPSAFDNKNKIVVGLVSGDSLMTLEGSETPSYLDFEEVCTLISKEAFKQKRNKFPLFLYLNIQFESSLLEQKVYEILLNKFRARFLPAKYGFMRQNLGEIPIIDVEGKLILILSKKPRNPNLFELSNGINNEKDMRFYNVSMTNSQMNYGGIKTIAIEPDTDIVEKTKFNLSRINIKNSFDTNNVDTPKSDLKNLEPDECLELGFNFICMNFQLWEDGKMEKYMNFFKESPFVVKNEKLRYIPKPPKPIKKQTPAVDSSLRINEIHNGFGNFDI